MTEDVVRTLNPDRSLADVTDAAAAIGYSPAHLHTAPLPGGGVGVEAPLVTAPERHLYTTQHFLLEPDGEGFHRIMVHHSGQALEAAGTRPGVGLVQREPHDGASQKFRIEEYHDGAFHARDRISGFDDDLDDDLEDHEGDCDLPERGYRILAKESGLAVQAGASVGDPVQLAEPRTTDPQEFVPGSLYGYGRWMFLTLKGTGLRITVR
ncbi:RICIN domain-containing protein [Streptomyces arboris]|uniref:RICIN domain-containing protein n=1 Tax=Streptomyces arboris TaxID=2600619 RepID=UPI003BF52B85